VALEDCHCVESLLERRWGHGAIRRCRSTGEHGGGAISVASAPCATFDACARADYGGVGGYTVCLSATASPVAAACRRATFAVLTYR
jgi:hypothetical protein